MGEADRATCSRCGAPLSAGGPPGLCQSCQVDDAIAKPCAAIRIDPDDPVAHCNLGVALHTQGNVEGAIVEFRAAIRIEPNLGEAHSNLGALLDRQGKLEEAIAEFRKARDNAPRGSELARQIKRALTESDH